MTSRNIYKYPNFPSEGQHCVIIVFCEIFMIFLHNYPSCHRGRDTEISHASHAPHHNYNSPHTSRPTDSHFWLFYISAEDFPSESISLMKHSRFPFIIYNSVRSSHLIPWLRRCNLSEVAAAGQPPSRCDMFPVDQVKT